MKNESMNRSHYRTRMRMFRRAAKRYVQIAIIREADERYRALVRKEGDQ